MKWTLVVLLLPLLCLSPGQALSKNVQTSPLSAGDAKVNRYRADLSELAERIKQEHPDPFRVITEADFDALLMSEQSRLDATSSKRDLLWAFSRVLASIGCGHSRMSYFNQENALITAAERFPVEVRRLDERLLIIDPLSNDGLLRAGEEVIAINGREVSDILAEIALHIGTDANLPYYRTHLFNGYATSYLTYALDFPDHYRIRVAGRPEEITLKPLQAFTFKPRIAPTDPCQDNLCYRVDAATDVGIMTVRSFAYYGERGAEFLTFVERAFADATEHQRRALIIDVRGNQGGSGLAAAAILKRLASTPFAYFSGTSDPRGRAELFDTQTPVETGYVGPVVVLTNGDTVSSVPHFLALVKTHGMALLAGEPAGGNHVTHDGAVSLVSSEFGIEYRIARMRFEVAVSGQAADDPILPDIPIAQSAERWITGRDVMLESLLGLISREDPALSSASTGRH